MKMPWAEKTGLAKAIALFATILFVSLGLCGLNIVAAVTLGDRTGMVLSWTAMVESGGVAIGVGGIAVVCFIGLVRMISEFTRSKRGGD